MAHLIVRDRRLLRCPGTRRLSVCAGVDPCGPGGLLCVTSCNDDRFGCPECIAVDSAVLPGWFVGRVFVYNGRCYRVSGEYTGEPLCIVRSLPGFEWYDGPYGCVPEVGQSCDEANGCDPDPCSCDGSWLGDVPPEDWPNFRALVTLVWGPLGACIPNPDPYNGTAIQNDLGGPGRMTWSVPVTLSGPGVLNAPGLGPPFWPFEDATLAYIGCRMGDWATASCEPPFPYEYTCLEWTVDGGSQWCDRDVNPFCYPIPDGEAVVLDDVYANLVISRDSDDPSGCSWRALSDFQLRSTLFLTRPSSGESCIKGVGRANATAYAIGSNRTERPKFQGVPFGGYMVADCEWYNGNDGGVNPSAFGYIAVRFERTPGEQISCRDTLPCQLVETTPKEFEPNLIRGGTATNTEDGRPGDLL